MLVSAWFFSALSCFYSFLKRETATFGAASHMITTALFRVEPNWCGGFNPVYGIVWGWPQSYGKKRMETWARKVSVGLYTHIFRRKKRTNSCFIFIGGHNAASRCFTERSGVQINRSTGKREWIQIFWGGAEDSCAWFWTACKKNKVIPFCLI